MPWWACLCETVDGREVFLECQAAGPGDALAVALNDPEIASVIEMPRQALPPAQSVLDDEIYPLRASFDDCEQGDLPLLWGASQEGQKDGRRDETISTIP